MLDRRHMLKAVGLVGVDLTLHGSALAKGPLARRAIDVAEFGAAPGKTARENRTALERAIASVPLGGTLLIPHFDGRVLEVEVHPELDRALTAPHAMTIEIAGTVKAVRSDPRRLPMCWLRVLGNRVSILGDGALVGPGRPDTANREGDADFPALIHVTGDHFRFQGLTVHDVPKIGIHLWGCRHAEISATWRGGIADYRPAHTALLGIRATGGGGHRITGNRFERDVDGNRLITGYFAGGTLGATSGDVIRDNFADVHEKLAYLYSNGSLISNNLVQDAQQSDIVRLVGNNNAVEYLQANRIKGGVAIYGGWGNEVRKSEFRDVGQAGVFLSSGASGGPPANTRIADNVIISDPSAQALQDGIYLYLGRGGAPNCSIVRNTVLASGAGRWRSGIRVVAIPPHFSDPFEIADNRIDGAVDGISLRRVLGADPAGNLFSRLSRAEPVLRITS